MTPDLELRLKTAISRGLINADNENYSADMGLTILEARELLRQVQSVKYFLLTNGFSWDTATRAVPQPAPFAFHPDD